jgi:hypothetical protein
MHTSSACLLNIYYIYDSIYYYSSDQTEESMMSNMDQCTFKGEKIGTQKVSFLLKNIILFWLLLSCSLKKESIVPRWRSSIYVWKPAEVGGRNWNGSIWRRMNCWCDITDRRGGSEGRMEVKRRRLFRLQSHVPSTRNRRSWDEKLLKTLYFIELASVIIIFSHWRYYLIHFSFPLRAYSPQLISITKRILFLFQPLIIDKIGIFYFW